MGKLGHALPGLHFGKLTPTMLAQQDHDKPCLQENNGDNQRDLPVIALPYRWLPKQDFAPRWQTTFADLPSLQRWPFKDESRRDFGNRDIRRAFASKDTQRHASCLLSNRI